MLLSLSMQNAYKKEYSAGGHFEKVVHVSYLYQSKKSVSK